MTDIPILNDDDLKRLLTPQAIIDCMEGAIHAKAEDKFIAPPRFYVEAPKGALVFTVGGLSGESLGFRVYETFPGSSPDKTQLVAVFDAEDGHLEGLILGHALGALRTGGIGGVALKHLARADAKTLGLIGTGRQARTQLIAASAVRDLEHVKVFSRSREHRERFAQEMAERLELTIRPVSTAREAASDVDILILATTSGEPVIEADWLKPGMHITTVGPKFRSRHELPVEAAELAQVIATDSLAQVAGYQEPFFMAETPQAAAMVELAEVVAGQHPGRENDKDITLFCSVGLAGTEVALAHQALNLHRKETVQ